MAIGTAARLASIAALALAIASPAYADDMSGMQMPMPSAKPHKVHKHAPTPASKKPADQSDMSNMPGMPMDGASQTPPVAAPPASSTAAGSMADMPGMSHSAAQSGMASVPDMQMSMSGALGGYPMTRDSSGTSWQPDLAEHNGIHTMLGDWMVMAHAMLWGIYDTQSGPRGDDKLFGAGMIMGMAQRQFGASDTLNLRAMLSPDPLMGKSGYPLLLATGETANGVTPLVDRQHPHDLFMELSATYAHTFSAGNSAFLYLGYPGEPALGPSAFMHRVSGMDIPQAPITHHWMDSTHVTFGVATAGFVHDNWKLEVSQFTGREPDQNRYDFDRPRFDSTAIRATYNPDEHWSLQASWGFLKSPEQLDPTINERRTTVSATYVTKFGGDQSLAATMAWGLKNLSDGHNLNGVLFETEYKPAWAWTAFARAEWEQNDEVDVTGATRGVSALTVGGLHDWKVAEHAKFGLGASYTFIFLPSSVTPSYGSDPHGAMVFVRLGLE